MASNALKLGERKTAAILFADMTGFTAMSERLDPEEMDTFMSRVFGDFEAVIREYGGTVEKYIGDAMVAVFGVPDLHEDDPQRAVAAALRFLGRHDPCREARGACDEADFRVGIHAGLVATGTRGEFDVVTGHAMAVAQRLQAAAEPGGILVSDTVRRACELEYEFEGPLSVAAKGKKEAVVAWAVKGPAAAAPRDDAPFMGRKEALDELLRHYLRYDPAALSGRYVLGEAGIGKTRLVQALIAKARAFPDFKAPILAARAQKFVARRYAVAWDLALAYLGLDRDAPADRIAAALRGIKGLAAEHAAVLAGLAGDDGTQAEEREALPALYALYAAALGQAASSLYSPLLFVDNAQHMDKASREFLLYYCRRAEHKPFLLLAGREEPQALRDAFPELKALKLGPLAEDEATALAKAHWPACPDEQLKTIVGLSAGNPLFVREYASFARDRGELGSLPETIQTMFLTSLEHYPPAERDFIKMMSAFILNFSEDNARRVLKAAGGDPELAPAALERFVRDGILVKGGDYYSFRLDLLRKALYASVLNHNKRLIHGAIADLMLEMKMPHPLRLLRHLLNAERWDEAAELLLRDPERNYKYEFLDYLDPIYKRLAKRDPKRALQLLILKSALFFNMGKIGDAERELSRIMRAAVAAQDDAGMGFAYHMIAAHAAMSFSFQKARFTGQKALFYYRRARMSARSLQNVTRTLAWAELHRSNFDEARSLVEHCALLPAPDRFELSSARAEFKLYSGDYRGALAELDLFAAGSEGAAEANRPADDAGEGSVARFFGLDLKLKALWQLCDYPALGKAARELLALGPLNESALAQAHAMAACSTALAGRREEAEAGFLQAEFYADQVRNEFERVDALRMLCLCRLVSGDARKAEAAAKEALIPALRHSCYYPAFGLLVALTGIELARGREERARFYATEASYCFTTGFLLPYKDVILYYYYASRVLEGEAARKAPAIALRLLEDEKARIGDPELVASFLATRDFGEAERRLASGTERPL